MIVVWLATAEYDLDALVDFIAKDNPQVALGIFSTIRNSVNQLSNFPYIGRAGRVKQTRELVIPRLPYIIVYALAEQEIHILAVFHTSRKWPESFPEK